MVNSFETNIFFSKYTNFKHNKLHVKFKKSLEMGEHIHKESKYIDIFYTDNTANEQ